MLKTPKGINLKITYNTSCPLLNYKILSRLKIRAYKWVNNVLDKTYRHLSQQIMYPSSWRKSQIHRVTESSSPSASGAVSVSSPPRSSLSLLLTDIRLRSSSTSGAIGPTPASSMLFRLACTREGSTLVPIGSPAVAFEPGGSLTTSARPAGSTLAWSSCAAAPVRAEKPIGDV